VRDGLDVLSRWVDHVVGLVRGENPPHPPAATGEGVSEEHP
jgi:hypothetical protein